MFEGYVAKEVVAAYGGVEMCVLVCVCMCMLLRVSMEHTCSHGLMRCGEIDGQCCYCEGGAHREESL